MACNYAREPPYESCDLSLRSLACSAQGFGRGAIGGRDGEVFHVTTLAADGPGSLAEACNKTCPLWIVFDVSGTIELSKYIRVRSFKTIDGRGQRIKIHGHGLQLKECEHVIICNLELERGPDDGIQLKPNTRNIWIDRCTLSDYDDGLIDVTRASTDVTISRCRFANHNKTMLLSADPTHTFDRIMRVTIHHCFFDNTRQRHPRVRFGKAHLYNNYTRGWEVYAVCSAVEAEVLSQCCIYEASAKKKVFEYYVEKAPDKSLACCGSLRSEGDLILGGGKVAINQPEKVFDHRQYYGNVTIEAADERLKAKITAIAGWQNLPLPPDCQAGVHAGIPSSCGPPAQVLGPAMSPAYANGSQDHCPGVGEEGEGDKKQHAHLRTFWSYVTVNTKKYFDKRL